MVSIAATPSGDGILHAPSRTATVAFAQAAINIAAAGSVTFTPTTTAFGQPQHDLPLTMTICPSDSKTGACLQPPGPSATIQVANNQIVTLSTFVQGQGQAIPFDPANNRVYIMATQGGTAVGASSVAVDVP